MQNNVTFHKNIFFAQFYRNIIVHIHTRISPPHEHFYGIMCSSAEKSEKMLGNYCKK